MTDQTSEMASMNICEMQLKWQHYADCGVGHARHTAHEHELSEQIQPAPTATRVNMAIRLMCDDVQCCAVPLWMKSTLVCDVVRCGEIHKTNNRR